MWECAEAELLHVGVGTVYCGHLLVEVSVTCAANDRHSGIPCLMAAMVSMAATGAMVAMGARQSGT